MADTPTAVTINCTTGETSTRPLTDSEISAISANAEARKAKREEIQQKRKAKEENKATLAAALAETTGMSAEDIAALLK